MEKVIFHLVHDTARQRAAAAVQCAPAGYTVIVQQRARNTDQNAAMWPILQAFSDQLKWPVNGAMCSLPPEEWKDLRIAQGLDGHVVMLGQRTSKFSKAQFSEWLDFLKATAADRGVELNDAEAFA
jgi:hypothetical protein